MKTTLTILKKTAAGWASDNVFKHAAALAFYTLFSLAPTVIIAIALAGFFYGDDAARGRLFEELHALLGSEAATLLEGAVLRASVEGTGVSAVIGVVILFVAATTVFAQLQESLNQIWCVTPKPSRAGWKVLIKRRLTSLAVVLTFGFVLLVSLILSTAISVTVTWFQGWMPFPPLFVSAIDLGLSLVIVTILMGLIFKVLPDVRLGWRDVFWGALLAAILFVLGRFLISFYLSRATLASTYGAAGSLVVLLMWVYYSTMILFAGAEFVRASMEHAGKPVIPKPTAVRVRRQIIEEGEPEPIPEEEQ